MENQNTKLFWGVNNDSLLNENIHKGDLLMIDPELPLEDGRLYAYKVGETYGVGKLHLLPGQYTFTNALAERVFLRSEVTIIGRVYQSMGPIREQVDDPLSGESSWRELPRRWETEEQSDFVAVEGEFASLPILGTIEAESRS